jgi:hypothetical protein
MLSNSKDVGSSQECHVTNKEFLHMKYPPTEKTNERINQNPFCPHSVTTLTIKSVY